MASNHIVSNLLLSNPRKTTFTNPNTNRTSSHFVYDTNIFLANRTSIPAVLRAFPGNGQRLLQDGTVAFVIAKGAETTAEDGSVLYLLDAMKISPFSGDPAAADYDDYTPNDIYAWVFATGAVNTATKTLADGKSSGFDLSVSDYVRDTSMPSVISGRFAGDNARWAAKGPPKPSVNSLIQIAGPLSSVNPSGHLEMTIEHIVLGLGSASSVSTSSDPATASPAKRSKYSAIGLAKTASTSAPVASGSGSTAPAIPAPVASVTTGDADDDEDEDVPVVVSSRKDKGKKRAHNAVV